MINAHFVYQTLRQELLNSYERTVTLTTFAFTATGALVGYALSANEPGSQLAHASYPFIFLLPLLILGLLIVQLTNSLYTIFTISGYIRIFIESEYEIPKWETDIGAFRFYLRKKKPFKMLTPYNPLTFFSDFLYALAAFLMVELTRFSG
jgi:Ni,Fe-hydrogenase I cytochrome b subunit